MKFCLPALRFLIRCTEGKNESPPIFFSSMTPSYMWYICHFYCIAGHSLKSSGALMPKFKCLGDVFCIPSVICNIEVIAQHFSCRVKTVECGRLFLFIACRQLHKKSPAMGDKINQTNNSADNNLGYFFKATDFDDIAMKVKIMKIILNISPYFVLFFM